MKKHDFLSDRAREKSLSNLKQFQHAENKKPTDEENLPQAKRAPQVRDLIGKDAGCSGKTVDKFLYIEKHDPELAEKVVKGESDKEGKRLTIDGVYNKTKTQQVREETIAKLESIENQAVKDIEGVYDVVVLDPPWEIRIFPQLPTYKPLPYPTMSVEEIKELEVPCADDCHVFLWTTQKFLFEAKNILDHWGLEYVCTFAWVKNGGPKPLGLPVYATEFFIYARRGKPKFIDTKQFSTNLIANRGAHSEKPEEFYEMLRRVTAGRRIDMFNRRSIEGFDTWGNESAI